MPLFLYLIGSVLSNAFSRISRVSNGGVVKLQAGIPQCNIHPEVLHCHIRNANNVSDIVEHAYQYLLTPDMQPRDLTMEENSPDTWKLTKSYHSSRQPIDWLAKGADFAQYVKDELGIGKPITGRTGGQCAKLEGRVHKIWDKHKSILTALSDSLAECSTFLEQQLNRSFDDCPLEQIPHYLQLALEACRCCNNELSSAHPDIDALERSVAEYKQAVSFFSHPNMLRPLRYAIKAYDHILSWHMMPAAREMAKDQALSLGALGSGALESLNKYLKAALRANAGGGRQDVTHLYSNDRLVRAFVVLSADLRCMRRRWYIEQERRWLKRNAARASQEA